MTLPNRPYALIVKHSRIYGQGCYAAGFIPAGFFVVEYKGDLIPAEEACWREQDTSRRGIYTFWISGEWAIDGLVEGNAARFINHSFTSNGDYGITASRAGES